jgi:ABC-type hemin transport system ATPase subunit
MPLVAGLSDRLVALESGSIIAVGSPHEVLADPTVISSYLGVDRSTVNRSGPPLSGIAVSTNGKEGHEHRD